MRTVKGMIRGATLTTFVGALAGTAPAFAQATCPCPPEPKPGWRGSVGAGLSFTGGNTDTQNMGLSFDTTYDPKTKNLFKADGLYIRAKTSSELSADRSTIGLRDEYTISKRAYLIGEARYLRDRFKDLSYLITPLIGAGYRVVERVLPRRGGACDLDLQPAGAQARFRRRLQEQACRPRTEEERHGVPRQRRLQVLGAVQGETG